MIVSKIFYTAIILFLVGLTIIGGQPDKKRLSLFDDILIIVTVLMAATIVVSGIAWIWI